MMITKSIILLAFIAVTHADFCFSQCLTPTMGVNCGLNATTPYTCVNFDPLFTAVGVFAAGYTQVEMVRAPAITAANNFELTSTFTPSQCSINYTSTNITYFYDIQGQYVSTDYIYKRYTIIQPHFEIVIRLSIAFMGVWATSDYLNIYTYDGVTARNSPLQYMCTAPTVNYTQNLCNRTGNRVDCIYSYTITIPHNSTSLLFNISSLTNVRDSRIQYWSIFDLNIATRNCHLFCASCYSSSAATTCTSCAVGYYLTGNTCGACAAGMLTLPNTNTNLGGFCVSACPPGYYNTTTTACLACPTGCLSCTSATICLITTSSASSSGSQTSLFQKLLPLWVILIILGALIIVGIFWRLLSKGAVQIEQRERIVSQTNEKHVDQKMTTQEREDPINISNDKNVYIQEIDFNDHIKIDKNPRQRKRQERDMNRSNLNMNF